jgi:hypothetical protein
MEGTTSLSSIFNEKSLFEEYKSNPNPDLNPMTRPSGTDVRDSDHNDSLLQGSKRNTINQKIREFSTDRDIRPVRGAGHENMMQTSLNVIMNTEDREPPRNSSILLEEIDGAFDSHVSSQPSTSSGPKKKPSIVDRAKELEKGRI